MEAGKYRKRPGVVEAMELTHDNGRQVAEWCGGEYWDDQTILVPTLHGQVPATPGTWVVRGNADFYPIHPDVFAATYEPTAEAGAIATLEQQGGAA